MLWIGERTRQPDGAHVEFFSGVNNPIGCKIGPDASPEDVLLLCERLNPERIPGRLTLISRMGADRVFELLPPHLRAVRESGHPVVWVCDPMHANVFTTDSGLKTRHLDAIMGEIEGFFAAHRQERTWPGGVHLEFTGEDVTECLGGSEEVHDDELNLRTRLAGGTVWQDASIVSWYSPRSTLRALFLQYLQFLRELQFVRGHDGPHGWHGPAAGRDQVSD